METKELLTVPDFCGATGLGRTSVYHLLKTGALTAVKVGRRTLIRREDMEMWKAGLASYKPQSPLPVGLGYARHERGA